MLRFPSAVLLAAATAIAATTISTRAADTAAPVTFAKDVLPILQKNCQSCHRPGQIAPMSLLTYEEVRPWARAIKTKVESRQMPPWFADPQHGRFANDRSLRQTDIDTIVKWVDGGAPQGDPKDAPPAIEWPADGWQIKPDVIVRGPEFRVPAQSAEERHRVGDDDHPERIHEGHVDHVARAQAERSDGDAPHLHHVRAARPNVKYYEWNWSESPRDEDGVATERGATPAGAAHAAVGHGGRRAGDRRRLLLLRAGRAGRRLSPVSTRPS